jgi:hypothetical protein
MNSLLKDMEDAFNSIGTTMFSDDFCCKLLAWVYIFGGGNEAVTLNKTMHDTIKVAQDRLNLHGGEVPNAKLLPLLQRYMKEADAHERGEAEATWVNTEINSRYSIPQYKFENDPKHASKISYTGRPKASGRNFGDGRLLELFGESE